MKIRFFISPRRLKILNKKNESIAINVLFSPQNSEEIMLVYKSKHNLDQENKVLLLIINDDGDEKYYLL